MGILWLIHEFGDDIVIMYLCTCSPHICFQLTYCTNVTSPLLTVYRLLCYLARELYPAF